MMTDDDRWWLILTDICMMTNRLWHIDDDRWRQMITDDDSGLQIRIDDKRLMMTDRWWQMMANADRWWQVDYNR